MPKNNDFATFDPILDSVLRKAQEYYNNNGVESPNNDYFSKLVESRLSDLPSTPKPKGVESIDENSIYGVLPRKKIKSTVKQETKQIEYTPLQELNEIQNSIYNLNTNYENKLYLDKLARLESSYRPFITNQFGYYGLYQFGKGAFNETGYTKEDFNNIENQHYAALKLADRNKYYMRDIIPKIVGKTINGIKVSLNGLLAAAHLVGASTVKKWAQDPSKSYSDANGTTIEKYLKEFE